MDETHDRLAEQLGDRARDRGWQTDDSGGEWFKASPDGSERAYTRVVGHAVEARVERHPTGPSPGPDPELSNGPQVFDSCDEALDYAEANLGADRGQG